MGLLDPAVLNKTIRKYVTDWIIGKNSIQKVCAIVILQDGTEQAEELALVCALP